MLPTPYTLTCAYGAASQLLDYLKSKQTPVLRTRTVHVPQADGTKQPQLQRYYVTPKPISDGAQATLRLLLKLQLDAIRQVRQVPFLLEPATDGPPTPPPVRTNNEELARIRKVSSRAIRDHLAELGRIGAITARNFRGTNASFELWLSTKLLWEIDSSAVAHKLAESRSPAAPAPAGGTKVPLILCQDKQGNKEIDTAGEKRKTICSEPLLTGNTGPQPAAEPAPAPPTPPRQDDAPGNETAAAGGAAAPATAPASLSPDEARDYATRLWHYALSTVYRGQPFAPHQHERAIQTIYHGVYGGFTDPTFTPRLWARYHREALERLNMVDKYLRRRPGQKWLPAPYAEFVAGTGYFDADNHAGFVGTLQWLRNRELNRRQKLQTQALHRYTGLLRRHRLREPLPKYAQGKTRLQLYRYGEEKMRAFGPEALDLFRAQVAFPRATS